MTHALSVPQQWVDLYADVLYAYALKMIPNAHQAENLVQETFLAALKAQASFKGNSSEQTWLIGILRHKITDTLRSKYREVPVSNLTPQDISTDSFFDQINGTLRTAPESWNVQPDLIK